MRNPHIARLLGEDQAEPQGEPRSPQPPEPSADPEISGDPDSGDLQEPHEMVPQVQELLSLWQQGERAGVAAKLMFTSANYVDFVDLVFALGQRDGRELGLLLDELADSQNIRPPRTPPQFRDMLRAVSRAHTDPSIV